MAPATVQTVHPPKPAQAPAVVPFEYSNLPSRSAGGRHRALERLKNYDVPTAGNDCVLHTREPGAGPWTFRWGCSRLRTRTRTIPSRISPPADSRLAHSRRAVSARSCSPLYRTRHLLRPVVQPLLGPEPALPAIPNFGHLCSQWSGSRHRIWIGALESVDRVSGRRPFQGKITHE